MGGATSTEAGGGWPFFLLGLGGRCGRFRDQAPANSHNPTAPAQLDWDPKAFVDDDPWLHPMPKDQRASGFLSSFLPLAIRKPMIMWTMFIFFSLKGFIYIITK